MSVSTSPAVAESRVVRSHADLILDMPEGQFTRADLAAELSADDPCIRGTLRGLVTAKALRVVEKEAYSADQGGKRNVYELTEGVREMAECIVEQREAVCPCGHSGFSHDEGGYGCTYEFCSKRFERGDLEVDG